jgi:aldehyde dehydrogenase (NAD+)
MTPEFKSDGFFINGGYIAPAGDEVAALESPATGEVYAEVIRPTTVDADRALAAARGSFDDGAWASLPVAARVKLIERACTIVEGRTEEVTHVSAFEMGAPLNATRMTIGAVLSVTRAVCKVALEAPDVIPGIGLWEHEVEYEPLGVVVDIAPWNGPFTNVLRKSAVAMIAGCSVVSKPPPDAPFSSLRWAEALAEAGLPAGVFNLLPAGPEPTEHLITQPGVDKVVFTGGTSVGRRVAELCGATLTRVVLELGGKSPAVILDDADLDLAAGSIAAGVFFNSGQICSALSRAIVPRDEVDQLAALLERRAKALVIGDPFDDRTTMGPMAAKNHYLRVQRLIDGAKAEGAKLLFGGGTPPGLDRGWFIEPTAFVVDNDMTIAREEVFGPVAALIPHDGEDDAVRLANDSAYGLNASVFSADESRARRVASRLQSGAVALNGFTTDMLAPRDPYKSSGIGTISGMAGYLGYRKARLVNIRAASNAWNPSGVISK